LLLFFTEGLKGSIKKLGLTQGIFYQLMINISANISRDLGMVPGGEFRRAVVEVPITKIYFNYTFTYDRYYMLFKYVVGKKI